MMGHEQCLTSISSFDPDEMQRALLPGVSPYTCQVSHQFRKRTASPEVELQGHGSVSRCAPPWPSAIWNRYSGGWYSKEPM